MLSNLIVILFVMQESNSETQAKQEGLTIIVNIVEVWNLVYCHGNKKCSAHITEHL